MEKLFVAAAGAGVLLIIALCCIVPVAVIWSLNTLFSFSIPYNFETWFAALILSLLLSGSGVSSSCKK